MADFSWRNSGSIPKRIKSEAFPPPKKRPKEKVKNGHYAKNTTPYRGTYTSAKGSQYMEQKQSLFKWLSVVLLDVGFLAYVVYLFCRKPAGMNGTEYEHIGGFIVDTFMIGGAILGLLLPKRFGKLAGFCIVGLSFANLVMTAVEQTGAVFVLSKQNASNRLTVWLDFFAGFISMLAIVCLVLSLAFPKLAKILGPSAAIALAVTGLIAGIEGIVAFTDSTMPWAYGINLIAVCAIILGLSAGLIEYAWLLKPGVGEKAPEE